MTSAPRILILTPRLDGRDGVSAASRLAIEACSGALGPGAVEVWAFDGAPAPVPEGVRARSAAGLRSRLAGWALARAASRGNDLLIVAMHLHVAPIALPMIARGARLACVLLGIEAWRPLRGRERAALTCASVRLAISDYTVGRFRAANPQCASMAVRVCALGISDGPRQSELPAERDYALIVGRLASDERYKGHERLIESWSGVTSAVPNARLLVVGDGDDRGRLEQLARDRGVDRSIDFLGRVSDRQRDGLYEHAAFFVMPSTDEGFGLVYLEAMRAGKACIAAPGAAQEIVIDQVTGIIVEPASQASLTAALVRLFEDRRLRDEMGKAGAQRLAERFTARHFAARLVEELGLATPVRT